VRSVARIYDGIPARFKADDRIDQPRNDCEQTQTHGWIVPSRRLESVARPGVLIEYASLVKYVRHAD
jgi:hypothetical protein